MSLFVFEMKCDMTKCGEFSSSDQWAPLLVVSS